MISFVVMTLTQRCTMPSKRFIGIDPGSKGCVACIEGDTISFYPLTGNVSTYQDCIDILSAIGTSTYVAVEDVHGLPGQSCTANTTFMKLAGMAELVGWYISTAGYMKVSPVTWKKHFGLTSKGLSKTERKHLSIDLAKKLYPSVADQLTASRDGWAEALLIARYYQDVLYQQELQ